MKTTITHSLLSQPSHLTTTTATLTPIALLLPLLLFGFLANAYAEIIAERVQPPCEIKHLKSKAGFEIYFDPALRTSFVGQRVQTPVLVRFPKTGEEVQKATALQCNGLIPRGAVVKQIQITQVKDLPRGVTWRSDNGRYTFAGGETGCFWLEGTAQESGHHTVEINSQGTGEFFGISMTNHCTMRIEDIIVISQTKP